MKRKNFFTGSVFQFYVPEIEKYAFCKFFDFKHISPLHGLLAQVFDRFSEKEQNDIGDLKNADWLFGPRSMYRWPDLKLGNGWKSLGILSSPVDEIIPDFKGTTGRIVKDESNIENWYAIRNFKGLNNCSYSKIAHLEHIVLTTTSLGMVWRTGMEYCRINSMQISKHYNLEETGKEMMYNQMINVPIYNTIPIEIRGRALI